jgi:DNA-binding GntR family transcriptional regulator
MLAAETAILHSYGWVDRDAGIVRIPIERAIEILAERGLPTRDQGQGSSAQDQHEHQHQGAPQ